MLLSHYPEGRILLPVARGGTTNTNGAACYYQNPIRDSWQMKLWLKKLAKVEALWLVSQTIILRNLLVAVATIGEQHFATLSSCRDSLSKSFSSLPKEDYRHSLNLSSVLFCTTRQVAATPTA
jgi:hypothetical protein